MAPRTIDETDLLQIRLLGDPLLRQKAAPIDSIDGDTVELARRMRLTMLAAPGVGLAAPQVGYSLRLICVDTSGDGDAEAIVTLANPVIVEAEGAELGEEGCLSIPGQTGMVERATRIVVEGMNLDGTTHRAEYLDLAARIFQHEIDHLEGILFIDYLSRLQRGRIIKRFRRRDRRGQHS